VSFRASQNEPLVSRVVPSFMPVTYELQTRLTGILLGENSNNILKLECDMKLQYTKGLAGNVAVINEIRDESFNATAHPSCWRSPSHSHS
jgi:hypothetical protein